MFVAIVNKEVIPGAVRSVCQRLTSAQHCSDCVARLRANTVQNNKEAVPSVNFERRPHNDNDSDYRIREASNENF